MSRHNVALFDPDIKSGNLARSNFKVCKFGKNSQTVRNLRNSLQAC